MFEKSTARLSSALVAIFLTGCSAQSDDDSQQQAAVTDVVLPGTSWQVEDIDQRGVIDFSNVSLEFAEDGRIAGSTGCNRYFGSASIEGSSIGFSELGSTRRACAEALMNQEQRFLAALGEITSYRMDANARLLLLDDRDTARLRLVAAGPSSGSGAGAAPGATPQDAALPSGIEFSCGDAGLVATRFLGPETIELTLAGRSEILQREHSASGARYGDADLEFWNKGNEALLTVDGTQHSCTTEQ